MADKAISELTAATQVGSTDLFVLEQGNVAKKLTGQTLENWLLALAEAHGGIVSLVKTGTSGLVDTYTITFSDETTTTFTVTNGKGVASVTKTPAVAPSLVDTYTMTFTDNTTYQWTVSNGKGVSSIAKASTSGLTDTYRITYNDGTTSTFTVTNGKGITSITDKWAVSSSNTQTPTTWYNAAPELTPTNKYLWHYSVIAYNDSTSVDTTKAVVGVYGDTGQNWYVWIKYAAQQPTQDSDMTDNPSNWIGMYSGTASTAPTAYTSYTWSQFKGNTGNGIASIAKTATSGLTDTYTVTFTDGDTFDFDVANGKSIVSVELTSTSGLTDTYTITFNDGTTTTFPVVNGRSIVSVSSPSTVGLVDTYTITYNDGTTSTFTVTNAKSITSVAYVSSSGLRDNYTISYNDGTTSSFYITNGKGISTIAKTSTSGLTDTYTITFSDNTTSTFTVTNGSDIDSISKTSTSGLVDTYTVTLSDGTSSTFTVTNGKGITSIELVSGTHAAGTTDTYRINFNDGDTTTFTVYNGANGEGAVSSVAGIGVVGDQGDVPLINWGNGAPTASTAGYLKQLYFDISGGIMYICTGISGNTYTWASMGITVDSALSTSSTNPVRNSVISAKVGTDNLSGFTANNLTGAANELMTNKAEKTATVSTVTYDSTNHKLTKTINGTASDVMTVDALPTNGSNNPVTSDGVYDKLAEKAPLDSPEFINNPTAPTQNAQDSSNKLATTSFVQGHVSALSGAITSGTLLNGMPQAEMRIPANSDFNSYTTAGTYYVNSDADAGTIAHIPRSASGTLFVINRAVGNYKTQYYITTSSAEIIFVRNYNSGSWTSWKTYFTSEHDNANIAKVLEDWIAPAGGLKQDEVIFGPNGMLYKAITAISANDTLNIGTNIDSTIISDHLVEMGTWTPHIYDLNTYVRNATYQGQYIKAGNIIILTYSTPDVAGAGEDFSGINTMLQYRNLPYSATIVGGSTSFTNDLGDYHSIQAGIFGRVYFRPNIKSSDFSDATKVAFGFFAFGIVSN